MKNTQNIEIPVAPRGTGKHAARTLRKENRVPGVVYGPKIGNITFETEERIIKRYLGHGFDNTIFTLTSSDSKLNKVAVMFKGKDIHPLTRRLTHVDFYALDLTKTIRVNVELRFTGKAKGLADGGHLQAIARDVEVECLPTAIPEFFELDVSDLGVHESLHASDVKLPDGVKLITDPTVTLVTVTIIKEEDLTTTPAAAATAAEPEVIGKGKKEEGAEGAAAAPAADGKKAEAKKE
ncbi:MAG TPA: 50S ribosomal protein L25 [Bdellovibrionales bacterium]|nr:50S ribosomal protein L25 [Bdellovibrionales bacterium]